VNLDYSNYWDVLNADVIAVELRCKRGDVESTAEQLKCDNLMRVERVVLARFLEHLDHSEHSRHLSDDAVGAMLCRNRTTIWRWKQRRPHELPNVFDETIAGATKCYELHGVSPLLPNERRHQMLERLSTLLRNLLERSGFTWPLPGVPALKTINDNEWRYLVATYLIEARHLRLETETIVGASENETAGMLSAKEEQRIKKRLGIILSHMGDYDFFTHLYIDRWVDLYWRLQLPWLVLVWMLGYVAQGLDPQPASADRPQG